MVLLEEVCHEAERTKTKRRQGLIWLLRVHGAHFVCICSAEFAVKMPDKHNGFCDAAAHSVAKAINFVACPGSSG